MGVFLEGEVGCVSWSVSVVWSVVVVDVASFFWRGYYGFYDTFF